jgi:hypothetical protein
LLENLCALAHSQQPWIDDLLERLLAMQDLLGEIVAQQACAFIVDFTQLASWPQEVVMNHYRSACTQATKCLTEAFFNDVFSHVLQKTIHRHLPEQAHLLAFAPTSASVQLFFKHSARRVDSMHFCWDSKTLARTLAQAYHSAQDPASAAVRQARFRVEHDVGIKRFMRDDDDDGDEGAGGREKRMRH